ncbi:MAG: hypothetical protein ACR2PQ_10330 [Myxococcota bacterium]
MPRDFTIFLWLLKLGAPVNLYLLASAFAWPAGAVDPRLLVPAVILFAVSAFRCLFPLRYEDQVVLHDSPLSSIFLTRLLATFSEVAYIYLLSHVIRLLNVDQVGWVDALSWVMVLQVVISQGFVWRAILTEQLAFYFYEELGWFVIIAANTIASSYLHATVETQGGRELLLQVNLAFGALYLPWQCIHLRALLLDARAGGEAARPRAVSGQQLAAGLRRSIEVRNPRTDGESWGGLVGLTWMVGYWATLIPLWMHLAVGAFAAP